MHEDRFGPVDFVVVQFTDAAAAVAGFDRLVDLVDRGLIRVLDLEFVHSIAGVASTVPASRVHPQLAQLDGAASGLLDREDLDSVAADLEHGQTAAVLVYEDLPLLDVLDTWERGGVRIVTEGPVDLADLQASVETSVEGDGQ